MASRVLKSLEWRCMIGVFGKTIVVYRGADGDGVAADWQTDCQLWSCRGWRERVAG